MTLDKLQSIVPMMQTPLCAFAGVVAEVADRALHAFVLFGEVLAAEFDPKRNTARSVLVLGNVDLRTLHRLGEKGVKFGSSGISAPLVMTPSYIQASLDTFPLELLDIQQRHLVLLGEDCFSSLEFKDADLRHQCERELKTAMIGLRQGLLASAGKEKLLGAFITDAATGLLRVLRGMIRIDGEQSALATPEVLDRIEKLTQRSLPGLRTALDQAASHGWDQFEAFYRDVEALSTTVDAW